MFKNPFRDENHNEYASRTLEVAKLDLLKALENVEFYEAVVVYRRKQIARLEGANNAKTPKSSTNNGFPGTNDSDLRNPPALLGTL